MSRKSIGCCVYVIFRSNGDPCYVGQGKEKRLRDHFNNVRLGTHNNKHLSAIIKNAGGSLPIVKLFSHLTPEKAIEFEKAWIAALGRDPKGPLVNLTDGGEGTYGKKHSDETKQKIREKAKKRFESQEQRDRLSKALSGFHHSEETKAKMSLSHKGKTPAWMLDPEKAKLVAKKIGAAHSGKVLSEEQRRQIGDFHRRRPKSELHKQRIGVSRRAYFLRTLND